MPNHTKNDEGADSSIAGRPLAELVSPAALEAAIASMSKKLERIRIFAESAGDTITAEEAIRMIRALYPPPTPAAGVPVQVPTPPPVTVGPKIRSLDQRRRPR